MKNERYLINKIIKLKEKIVKICLIIICFTFLSGFYDDRMIINIDLKEITVELGEPINELNDEINSYLNNSNFILESSIPLDEFGCTKKIGKYNYYIVYRDEERKYSRLTNKKSTISVTDTIKPVIEIKNSKLEFNYGSKISPKDIAICHDLSDCELSFKENIDTKKSGKHQITVIATDEGQNITEQSVEIKIKEKPIPVYYRYDYSGSVKELNEYNNNLNSTLTEEEKESLRYQLVSFAKMFNGNPYVYGGTSLTNGTDCSGFVMSVYNNFGYRMPRVTTTQAFMGIQVSANNLLPGDIVAYETNGMAGHVGIYIGSGMMIHASTPQTGIVIIPMYDGYRTYHRIIY